MSKLPEWKDCIKKEYGDQNPLERFIAENEPSGDNMPEEWRNELYDAIKYVIGGVQAQCWLPLSENPAGQETVLISLSDGRCVTGHRSLSDDSWIAHDGSSTGKRLKSSEARFWMPIPTSLVV